MYEDEAEFPRSAISTTNDESVAQSDADGELSRGSENDDADTATPLVTLKRIGDRKALSIESRVMRNQTDR